MGDLDDLEGGEVLHGGGLVVLQGDGAALNGPGGELAADLGVVQAGEGTAGVLGTNDVELASLGDDEPPEGDTEAEGTLGLDGEGPDAVAVGEEGPEARVKGAELEVKGLAKDVAANLGVLGDGGDEVIVALEGEPVDAGGGLAEGGPLALVGELGGADSNEERNKKEGSEPHLRKGKKKEEEESGREAGRGEAGAGAAAAAAAAGGEEEEEEARKKKKKILKE